MNDRELVESFLNGDDDAFVSLMSKYQRLVFYTIKGVLLNSDSARAESANFPEVMIIFDASGSMWGVAGNESKINSAKAVLHQLIPSLPDEVNVGLTVYGHRRKGDCGDIEILLPAGSRDRSLFLQQVDAISPKGKTPISDAIKMVVLELKNRENETTIILVSDGEET